MVREQPAVTLKRAAWWTESSRSWNLRKFERNAPTFNHNVTKKLINSFHRHLKAKIANNSFTKKCKVWEFVLSEYRVHAKGCLNTNSKGEFEVGICTGSTVNKKKVEMFVTGSFIHLNNTTQNNVLICFLIPLQFCYVEMSKWRKFSITHP